MVKLHCGVGPSGTAPAHVFWVSGAAPAGGVTVTTYVFVCPCQSPGARVSHLTATRPDFGVVVTVTVAGLPVGGLALTFAVPLVPESLVPASVLKATFTPYAPDLSPVKEQPGRVASATVVQSVSPLTVAPAGGVIVTT